MRASLVTSRSEASPSRGCRRACKLRVRFLRGLRDSWRRGVTDRPACSRLRRPCHESSRDQRPGAPEPGLDKHRPPHQQFPPPEATTPSEEAAPRREAGRRVSGKSFWTMADRERRMVPMPISSTNCEDRARPAETQGKWPAGQVYHAEIPATIRLKPEGCPIFHSGTALAFCRDRPHVFDRVPTSGEARALRRETCGAARYCQVFIDLDGRSLMSCPKRCGLKGAASARFRLRRVVAGPRLPRVRRLRRAPAVRRVAPGQPEPRSPVGHGAQCPL